MFVSVIMPIYNGEAFLREAIESVLAQTHREFELVAVDDGSTDGSPAILAEFAAAYPRVRVITQRNGGGARARNRALQEARAEWVINLDCDDVFLPNRIERQLAFLAARPEVKVFACRAFYIDRNGRIFGKTKCEPFTTRREFERYYAAGLPLGINHSAVAMHRPTILAVGGYRPEFAGAEDLDLWNRVAERGHLVLQQDEVLFHYRIHDTSVMASRTRQSWEAGDWAIACMRARRAGRPEPTREEFQRQLRARPWWRRLQRERQMIARVHYRLAGLDIAHGRWLRGAARLALAGCAWPRYVAKRLASQLYKPALARWRGGGGKAVESHPPAAAAPRQIDPTLSARP
jgi:glycosyltransferase involved in cell wall biosynthesis